MTFGEQVSATLIGSVAGFGFSLCLFYLKGRWAKATYKVALQDNVVTEIAYNIKLLSQTQKDLQKEIEKVTVNDRNVYCNVNYGRFGRFFLHRMFPYFSHPKMPGSSDF